MMGGCLHDRLLTVGDFYSQQKQATDDTWFLYAVKRQPEESDIIVHSHILAIYMFKRIYWKYSWINVAHDDQG